MNIEQLKNMAIEIGLAELNKMGEIAQQMAEEKDIEGLMDVIGKLIDLNRQQLENQR